MSTRTWFMLGATSIIAQEFAHLAARAGNKLVLVGRGEQHLAIIAADIRLRHHVDCAVISVDFGADITHLINALRDDTQEIDLFVAHTHMISNDQLDVGAISKSIHVNIVSTIQLIYTYLHKPQSQHRLIFLSSVAACRGRAKNSFYGANKAAVELYLQGLQQAASANQHITIARLGFIDTKLTYGEPGVFYAASPEGCAMACWKASFSNNRLFYYPFFWRMLMGVIMGLPFFIYKKMRSV